MGSRNEVQNFGLIVPEQGLGIDSKEGWNIGINAEAMIDQMENFHPSLQAVVKYLIPSIHIYQPITNFESGKPKMSSSGVYISDLRFRNGISRVS